MSDKLCTVKEASAITGLSVQVIYNYRNTGRFPPADEIRDGKPFWLESTLNRYDKDRPRASVRSPELQ